MPDPIRKNPLRDPQSLLLWGVALLTCVFLLDAALGWRNIRQLRRDHSWVTHTHEVLEQTDEILQSIADVESDTRAYVITGDERFLQPTTASVQGITSRIDRALALTQDNPRQQERIARLRTLVQERIRTIPQGDTLRHNFGIAAARELIAHGGGTEQMASIRQLTGEIQANERDLLRQREITSRRAYVVATATEVMGAVLGMLLLTLFAITLRRSVAASRAAALQIEEQRNWLGTTLTSIGDAVIATDTADRVRFINAAAERLTGWTQHEAMGLPLRQVFHIVNERTHERVENPTQLALGPIAPTGVTDPVLLVARDGTQIPLDDSVAPVVNSAGQRIGTVLVFRDITARRNRERAVEQRTAEAALERERLRVTLLSIGDGCITTNVLGCVTFLNPVAERLTGWTTDEAAGRPLTEVFQIINEESREPVEDPVTRVLREGIVIGLANHTVLIDRNRNERAIEDSAAPILTPEGKTDGVVLVFHDATDLRETERQLRKSAKQLQESALRKDNFLATLAHELRNPLAPVRTSLEILKRPDATPALAKAAIDVMDRQVSHMVRLVEDLVDAARITQDKFSLRIETICLTDLIHHAAETVRPELARFGQRLEVELPEASVFLQADFVRLAQVLTNLLNNASKFSPKGECVNLSATLHHDTVQITVRDRGIGIPEERLVNVFDMFAQGEHPLQNRRAGLGIGLAVVRRLVEMHGGTVRAESMGIDQGSSFTVRLPRSVEAHAPEATIEARPARQRLTATRILVVDDNADAANSLGQMLELEGAHTRIALNGEEALRAVDEFRPAIVLLDIGLPTIDGYEVCRRLRAETRSWPLRIVALTGWGDERDLARSAREGFDGHLVKPVGFSRLLALVEKFAGET